MCTTLYSYLIYIYIENPLNWSLLAVIYNEIRKKKKKIAVTKLPDRSFSILFTLLLKVCCCSSVKRSIVVDLYKVVF